MRAATWGAVLVAGAVLVGCGETTPTRTQQSTQVAPAGPLDYRPHPWTDAVTLWHRDDLTTTDLQSYTGFMLQPVVIAQEGQKHQPNVKAINADIIQTHFPTLIASAMHPRYELVWEEGEKKMKMQVVLLAAAQKPSPGDELMYLPVNVRLNAQGKDGKPLIKRITIALSALRVDLMDASSNAPILSIVDPLEEVKAAWRREESAPLLEFEQLVRHWAVKIRFNLDSLQEGENQLLRNAG